MQGDTWFVITVDTPHEWSSGPSIMRFKTADERDAALAELIVKNAGKRFGQAGFMEMAVGEIVDVN